MCQVHVIIVPAPDALCVNSEAENIGLPRDIKKFEDIAAVSRKVSDEIFVANLNDVEIEYLLEI